MEWGIGGRFVLGKRLKCEMMEDDDWSEVIDFRKYGVLSASKLKTEFF